MVELEKKTCHFGHEMKVVLATYRDVDDGGGSELLYRCDECGQCLHVRHAGMSIERFEEHREIKRLLDRVEHLSDISEIRIERAWDAEEERDKYENALHLIRSLPTQLPGTTFIKIASEALAGTKEGS